MRREQLEHAIRTACQIVEAPEVIVVGSQAILGTYCEDELPAAATMSLEVDILPIADDEKEVIRLSDLIEGSAGEFSDFESTHGFSIDGVDLATSALPDGWWDRLVKVLERQHGPSVGGARVHRVVPRKARSLRRQALRVSGEGPQFCRCSS